MTIFEKFLQRAEWHWAKSYAKTAPHWYVVRGEFADDKTFDDVVLFMRENGVDERFYSKTFTYYYHGGFKYWTMGNPVEQTTIINRAKV